MNIRAFAALGGLVFAAGLPCAAFAQSGGGLTLSVDASRAPQKIYHCAVTMPAKPGPFTFVYPKWIPGYHSPSGPLPDVVDMRVRAAGTTLEWRRDLVDYYAIHTTIPNGASSLEVDFDLIDAPPSIAEQNPVETANLATFQWSSFFFYPEGAVADTTPITATLTLPSGWESGSALPIRSSSGNVTHFDTVSLTTLVDSPLVSGRYFRRIALPSDVPMEIDAAADSEAALDAKPELITGFKHLVAEAPAFYGSRHYRTYHFLLTLTDSVAFNGIEHHESSDNRAGEQYLTDMDTFRDGADLLPHEYSHSWNGKFRRPADLLEADFQAPELTDLLWVYEGLNQYNGEVLTVRSRLLSLEEQRELDAMNAASMDTEYGRNWRPIRDIADIASILYSTPNQWGSARRASNDFYVEMKMVWLEADTIIRTESHGTKSLDDFVHLWTLGGSTTPSVKTYTLDDVVATLNATQPYDWRGFLNSRVATIQPHAPLGGYENAGWKLAYVDEPSAMWKAHESVSKVVDLRYSLGMTVSTDDSAPGGSGAISDVIPGTPAFEAGIAPGMKLLGVNGRHWSADTLHDAITAAKTSHRPLQMLATNGDFYQTYSVEAFTGNRYPVLQRDPSKPDMLSQIYAPRTYTPSP